MCCASCPCRRVDRHHCATCDNRTSRSGPRSLFARGSRGRIVDLRPSDGARLERRTHDLIPRSSRPRRPAGHRLPRRLVRRGRRLRDGEEAMAADVVISRRRRRAAHRSVGVRGPRRPRRARRPCRARRVERGRRAAQPAPGRADRSPTTSTPARDSCSISANSRRGTTSSSARSPAIASRA